MIYKFYHDRGSTAIHLFCKSHCPFLWFPFFKSETKNKIEMKGKTIDSSHVLKSSCQTPSLVDLMDFFLFWVETRKAEVAANILYAEPSSTNAYFQLQSSKGQLSCGGKIKNYNFTGESEKSPVDFSWRQANLFSIKLLKGCNEVIVFEKEGEKDGKEKIARKSRLLRTDPNIRPVITKLTAIGYTQKVSPSLQGLMHASGGGSGGGGFFHYFIFFLVSLIFSFWISMVFGQEMRTGGRWS